METKEGMEKHIMWKQKHPDAIILMRIGDSYETYSEDADVLRAICNCDCKNGIASFSHHVLYNYLRKLIENGYRVGICEEIMQKKKHTISSILKNNK